MFMCVPRSAYCYGDSSLITDLADECGAKWGQKGWGISRMPKLEHYTISKIGCWGRPQTRRRLGHPRPPLRDATLADGGARPTL